VDVSGDAAASLTNEKFLIQREFDRSVALRDLNVAMQEVDRNANQLHFRSKSNAVKGLFADLKQLNPARIGIALVAVCVAIQFYDILTSELTERNVFTSNSAKVTSLVGQIGVRPETLIKARIREILESDAADGFVGTAHLTEKVLERHGHKM
jgi:hypothetical protein